MISPQQEHSLYISTVRKERKTAMAQLQDILLVTDIDGTLLHDKAGLSAGNLEAITRFIQKGGNFAVATGRVYGSALPYIRSIPFNIPSIYANGAYMVDPKDQSTICPHYLPEAADGYLAQIVRDFPHPIGGYCMDEDLVYVHEDHPKLDLLRNTGLFRFVYQPADQFPKKKYKNMFTVDPAYMEELKAFVDQGSYPGVQFVASEPHLLEMLPEGTSKANAIDELCRYLGLEAANVYAVGDYYNDIPMLERAAHSVAVANAPAEVQAHAGLVVPSCAEDGVARLIERIEKDCGA